MRTREAEITRQGGVEGMGDGVTSIQNSEEQIDQVVELFIRQQKSKERGVEGGGGRVVLRNRH